MMKYLEMNIKSKTTHQKQATPTHRAARSAFPIVLLLSFYYIIFLLITEFPAQAWLVPLS